MGLATALVTGRKTLTGGADQLTATSMSLSGLAVTIISAASTVYIGPTGVTTANGFPLPTTGLALDIDDPSKVYLRGTSGDVIAFIGTRVS